MRVPMKSVLAALAIVLSFFSVPSTASAGGFYGGGIVVRDHGHYGGYYGGPGFGRPSGRYYRDYRFHGGDPRSYRRGSYLRDRRYFDRRRYYDSGYYGRHHRYNRSGVVIRIR